MSKIKLITFSNADCGVCEAMKKSGTVKKFAAKHPELEVEEVEPTMDNVPADEIQAAADRRAEKFRVRGLPEFVFVDEKERELQRHPGGIGLAGLEGLYQEAQNAIRRVAQLGEAASERRSAKKVKR